MKAQIQSGEILSTLPFKQRATIISFLYDSDTFGIHQSIRLLCSSFRNLTAEQCGVLVNEFWKRNPAALLEIYENVCN